MIIGADPTRLVGTYAARRWWITAGTNVLYLPPTGWLSMILLESNQHAKNALKASINFELTDTDEIVSFGRAIKRNYYEACGRHDEMIALRTAEPLINVNAALNYRLLADSSHDTELSVVVLSHPSVP